VPNGLSGQAEARLQPEDAGEGSRDPDRAAAIGADVQSPHAERAGDRGAAARAAGRPLGIPGIAGDAGERAVGDRFPAELRRGRLADQHRTLLAQARGCRRVLVPGLFARRRQAAAQGRPAPGQDQVLDRRGDAVEQALRLGPLPTDLGFARRLHGALRIDQAERVDGRLETLDPLQHRARDLGRGELPRPVEAEQFGRAEVGRVGAHGRINARCGRKVALDVPHRRKARRQSSAR
jgi:hypothetical protein